MIKKGGKKVFVNNLQIKNNNHSTFTPTFKKKEVYCKRRCQSFSKCVSIEMGKMKGNILQMLTEIDEEIVKSTTGSLFGTLVFKEFSKYLLQNNSNQFPQSILEGLKNMEKINPNFINDLQSLIQADILLEADIPQCLQTTNCPQLNRKILVLDLDETLIHTERANENSTYPIIKTQRSNIYFTKRPFLMEFLNLMSNFFDLILFSASGIEYCEEIIEELSLDFSIFSQILTRADCTPILSFCGFSKDLKILKRNLNDIVLVDDTIFSAFLQLDNYVPIAKFKGDPQDKELVQLSAFLLFIYKVPDVRIPIKEKFYLSEILRLWKDK